MTLIQNEDAKYTLTLFENEKKYNKRKNHAQKSPESLYQDEKFISDVTTKDSQQDVKTKIQISSTNELRFASETVITISMLELAETIKTFEDDGIVDSYNVGTRLLYESNTNDRSLFDNLRYYVSYETAKRIFQSMGIIGWKEDFDANKDTSFPLYSIWTDAVNDDTTIVSFESETEEQVTHKIEYFDVELTENEMLGLGLFQLENKDTNEVYYIYGQDLERFMHDRHNGEYSVSKFAVSQFNTEA